ncbi:MAG: gamma-glutamylcyclotransferase [Anaerolineales bacterium]|nr:gamma-glutamylcyclotransferase [Anaerolineales bacterium]
MSSEHLFVYGTLRPPQSDTHPDDSRYYIRVSPYIQNITPARLSNAVLYDLGTYPGARPGPGLVNGELLTVAPAALDILDQHEGHPHFFYRERVHVETAQGIVEAWIYYAPESLINGHCPIPNGDWLRRGLANPLPSRKTPPLLPVDATLTRVLARLVNAKRTWLSTTRPDGRSRLRPVEHLWHNERMYVLKHKDSDQLQDILQNPAVTLAHPAAASPITLEGWATPPQNIRPLLHPLFLARYGIDIEKDPYTIIEITPLRLSARGRYGQGNWRGNEVAKAGRGLPGQTRK